MKLWEEGMDVVQWWREKITLAAHRDAERQREIDQIVTEAKSDEPATV